MSISESSTKPYLKIKTEGNCLDSVTPIGSVCHFYLEPNECWVEYEKHERERLREVTFLWTLINVVGEEKMIGALKNIIENCPDEAVYFVFEGFDGLKTFRGHYSDKCIIGIHDVLSHMRISELSKMYFCISIVKKQGGVQKSQKNASEIENKAERIEILKSIGLYKAIFSSIYIENENYLNNLPVGGEYDPPERIVCAANRYSWVGFGDNPIIVLGVRHGCSFMNDHIEDLLCYNCNLLEYEEEQGFLTSKSRFVNRQEAWKIALEQRQIVRRVGNDTANGGTLYSENLY